MERETAHPSKSSSLHGKKGSTCNQLKGRADLSTAVHSQGLQPPSSQSRPISGAHLRLAVWSRAVHPKVSLLATPGHTPDASAAL